MPAAAPGPRRRACAVAVLGGLAAAAAPGCNVLAGIAELHVVPGGSDVGVDSAEIGADGALDAADAAAETPDALVDAADATDGGEAGAPIACAAYVDAKAAAGGDGSRGAPLRSVDAALLIASPGEAVCVCVGAYEGSLRLTKGVSLLGGFSCTSWARPVDYGYPSFTAPATEIVGVGGPALTIDAPGMTRSTSIDGLTLTGPSDLDGGSSIGASVVRGSPTLTNTLARGGARKATTSAGSVGLKVSGGSGEYARSRFAGGAGTSPLYGSVGLWIDAGAPDAPYVHHDVIDGGTGTRPGAQAGGRATVGVYFGGDADYTTAQGNPFEYNEIHGGAGTCIDGPSPENGGFGVFAVMSGGHLELRHDGIEGGATRGGASRTWGVYLLGIAGHYLLAGNRIDGGLRQAAAVGVEIADVVLEDNFIHGGLGTDGYGVWIAGARCALRHNVILAPPATAGGVSAAIATSAADSVTGAVVENNVLGGVGAGGSSVALLPSTCASGGPFASVRNNLVFGFTRGMLGYGPTLGAATDPGCSPLAWHSDVAAAEGELSTNCAASSGGACGAFGGARAEGDVTIAASCAGRTSCVPVAACADGAACWAALFSPWSASSTGYADLFPISGAPTPWSPRPGAPCVLTRGGLPLPMVEPVDYAGVPWGGAGAHAIGALQIADPTCSP